MVKLPVKKCFFLAKIFVLFMLVVTILSLFEQWRGGKRTARAQFAEATDQEYERQILEDEARIVPGLGAGGVAAYLSPAEKDLGAASEKKYAINTYLSERISLNRTLKDARNPACKRITYDAELPSASVIIIFHNEPYSVVLRTVWSVLNTARRDQPWHRQASPPDPAKLGYRGQDPSSEFVYLKEIILVDDNSTLPALRGKLSHYVRTRLPPGLVRVVRLPDRQGLMRARLAGARAARGDALVFLDAHCEGGADWLRPLLQRLRHKPEAVATPVIDVIHEGTFALDADTHQFQVGGFTFVGHFTWVDVPEREKRRRGSDIAPTWSPTMAGGLFAVSRAYYWELGAYDEQMTGWGGENLEMSFRVWQCGGTLETIPCSRVGHVFRAFHPYGMPANSDTHGINTARMAEVWMDEYAELFYLHRPDLRKNPIIGDVTHRRVLREKLRCKSFRWYLENVYKEKFVPVRDVSAYGRVQNPSTGLCLDTMQREQEAAPLGLYPCHSSLSATQYLSLSLDGQLRDEEKCVELQYTRRSADESAEDEARTLIMVTCGKQRAQQWRYLPATQQLQHVESGLCLAAGAGAAGGGDAAARSCRAVPAQQWSFDYGEYAAGHAGLLTADQEERLQMLKRQRRKSRSLMSMEAAPARRARHKRRGPRRKKKSQKSHKNKFILVVERTLMNNSREHLEVDIHCAHRRLLPNNSFVRDIVTILNEKNIRVINNGRVFERNRVTQLGHHEPKVLEKLELAADARPQPATEAAAAGGQRDAERTEQPDAEAAAHTKASERSSKKTRARLQAPTAAPGGPTPPPKRIIIEDFVEIKPATYSAPKRSKKRKHKHARPSLRSRLTPPSEPEHSQESPMLLSKRLGGAGEALDARGARDEVRRASDESDDDYWTLGIGSPRARNSSHAHPTRTHDVLDAHDAHDPDDAHDIYDAHDIHDAHDEHDVHDPHDIHDAYEAHDAHETHEAHEALATANTLEPHGSGAHHDARFRVVSADGMSGEFREVAAERSRVLPARARLAQAAAGRAQGEGGEATREGEGADGADGDARAPVKLVMRSNLTFNLGDELFAWRRDNTGAEELVIPAPGGDSSASDSSAAD